MRHARLRTLRLKSGFSRSRRRHYKKRPPTPLRSNPWPRPSPSGQFSQAHAPQSKPFQDGLTSPVSFLGWQDQELSAPPLEKHSRSARQTPPDQAFPPKGLSSLLHSGFVSSV